MVKKEMVQTLVELDETVTIDKESQEVLVQKCNSKLNNDLTEISEIIYYLSAISLFVVVFYLLFRAAHMGNSIP